MFVEAGFTVYTRGFPRFFEAIAKCLFRVEIDGVWSAGERKDGVGDGRTGLTEWTPESWYENCLSTALKRLQTEALTRSKRGKKVIFIGNGGSASICSHMATDWTKNGGIRTVSLPDAPMITCLGNDFGFENVFAKMLSFYAHQGDLVIIISTSGTSPNIRAAAQEANKLGLDSVTFSGMDPDNPLRRNGRLRFYVPSGDYGLVELSHACLLHSIVSVTR